LTICFCLQAGSSPWAGLADEVLQEIAGKLDNAGRCNMAAVCFGWREAVVGGCWDSGREEVVHSFAGKSDHGDDETQYAPTCMPRFAYRSRSPMPRLSGHLAEPALMASFWRMHRVLRFSAAEVARTNVMRYAVVRDDAALVGQILATWPGLGAAQIRSRGLLLFAVEHAGPQVLETLRAAGFFGGAQKRDFEDPERLRVLGLSRLTWAVLELVLSSETATLRDVARWCDREPGDVAARVLGWDGGVQRGQYGAALARLRGWGLTLRDVCTTNNMRYVLNIHVDALREVVTWGLGRHDAAKLELLYFAVVAGSVDVVQALFEEHLVTAEDVLQEENHSLIEMGRNGNVEILRTVLRGVGGLGAANVQVIGKLGLFPAVRKEHLAFVRELFCLGLLTREAITEADSFLSGWVFDWLQYSRNHELAQMLLMGVTREDVVANNNQLVRCVIRGGHAGTAELLRHLRTEFGLTAKNIPRPGESLAAYAKSWPEKTDEDVLALVTELVDGWGLGRQRSQRSQRAALAKLLRALEEKPGRGGCFCETARYLCRKACL